MKNRISDISNFSLTYKLMVLLIAISISILASYSYVTFHVFSTDKIAFTYDANLSSTRLLAAQVRTELNSRLTEIETLAQGYNTSEKTFLPISKKLFQINRHIDSLQVIHKEGAKFRAGTGLQKVNSTKAPIRQTKRIVQLALKNEYALARHQKRDDQIVLAVLLKGGQKDKLVAVATLTGLEFLSGFNNPSLDFYLVDDSPMVSPQNKVEDLNIEEVRQLIGQAQQNVTAEFGVSEVLLGPKAHFVSIADVQLGKMQLASVVSKDRSLYAFHLMKQRSIYFVVTLIFVAVIVSLLGSKALTSNLNRLLEATRQIGAGNLDYHVNIKSRDEIQGLSQGFNNMVGEIRRLLKETADKARMEDELKTAQIVQTTLLPQENFEVGDVKLIGNYQSASECGGDWWHYTQKGDDLYVYIGDVTGHGVGSALVTSAAKSASAIIDQLPDTNPSDIMKIMNTAIHETSKGKLMMTGVVAKINLKTLKCDYCNASHNWPYLLTAEGRPHKPSSIDFLRNIHGQRLGEKSTGEYSEESVQLKQGDWLVFYTDGIIEGENAEGAQFGERRFIRAFLHGFNADSDPLESKKYVNEKFDEFKKDAPLVDDITYFVLKV